MIIITLARRRSPPLPTPHPTPSIHPYLVSFSYPQDLVSYASELGNKGSVLLLNKADLLPGFARRAWADYFDARNIRYVFWSAYEASVDLEIERGV